MEDRCYDQLYVIVIVAIILITLILFFTPFGKQIRVKLRGKGDEIMRQDAQTPEGARVITILQSEKKKNFITKHRLHILKFQGKEIPPKKICIKQTKI